MIRDRGHCSRWENPPLTRFWAATLSVLVLAYCAENRPRIAPEDRRIINTLAESVRLARQLSNHPDSLEQARRTLLLTHGLTPEDLTLWLEKNQSNAALWAEVELIIQETLDRSEDSSPPTHNRKGVGP